MRIQKHFIYILFLCSLLPILTTAAQTKTRSHLPTNSVAMSDDALATFFNPAGLGTRRALNLYYLRTYGSTLPNDDAFFIAAPNTGFSMEFANATEDIDFTRYNLSAGHHLGSALYWGTSYSWINSDSEGYDDYKSVSVGLMYRRRFFSIGAIGRDLNRPRINNQKLGRTYDIGFALRPGTWRTTLSVDMRKLQDVSDLDFSYGVEIRPIRELMLRGTYNSDKSYDIRFGINLGNFGIGSVNYFDENSTSDTGVGYFHFTTAAITKPISRKRVFLDLEMSQLERTLRIAKSDKDVAGVLIRLKGIKFGMGRLQEIRDAIIDFRKSGRIVACYITYCSTGDYIVASACDAIYMHPSADVRLVGLKFELSFYRDVLDKLGIRAELDHFGEYKSASEAFTRKGMSEKHRENMNAILDDLYDQLTTDIATARGWTPETVKVKVDSGPFTANQAIKSKIVDRLLYEDQLEHAIKKLVKRDVRHLRLYEYLSSSLYPQDWSVPNPKIAVIEAKGMMLTGESFYDLLTGNSVMGSSTISRAIDHCRTDDSIKAVVLRIDSVGGLVVAADIIWHKLMHLTAKKPLIVSMGDVAASGGYYIAVPAETIVAEPGTLTGSIGVIGGKHSLKGLYEKIGIKKEIMTRGKNADFFSNFSDFTPEQKENLRIQLKEIYDDFITKVAQGRENLTVPEVDEVARGRIWTGRQAKEIGLVDELGGLDKALAIAKERMGLNDKTVEIVRLPRVSWLSTLFGYSNFISTLKIPFLSNIITFLDHNGNLKLIEIIKKHNVFLLMPYDIDVNP